MSGPGSEGSAAHWDAAYGEHPQHSWDQPSPEVSLAMLRRAGLTAGDSVLDVGGGTSRLVDVLVSRGCRDVSVLDLSAVALEANRRRLADRAATVHWIKADLLAWPPPRQWDIWHDRAVFHFLTESEQRQRYRDTLLAATRPGSRVVLGVFAADGPTHCSGLPVARYDAAQLVAELNLDATTVVVRRELHHTPYGTTQPFTWIALRRGR